MPLGILTIFSTLKTGLNKDWTCQAKLNLLFKGIELSQVTLSQYLDAQEKGMCALSLQLCIGSWF